MSENMPYISKYLSQSLTWLTVTQYIIICNINKQLVRNDKPLGLQTHYVPQEILCFVLFHFLINQLLALWKIHPFGVLTHVN